MAQPINLEAEQKALITLIDGDKTLQDALVLKISEDYFGADFTLEVASRVFALYRRNQTIPSSSILCEDSILSDIARDHLKKIPYKPLQKIEDIDPLVVLLNDHKRVRILTNGLREVIVQVKNSDAASVDIPLTKLEQILMSARSAGNKQADLFVAGAGDSTFADHIVESVISGAKEAAAIPTGFKLFDERAGGFRRSNLVIIAGPSRGCKSLMRTQILKNMYAQQHLNTGIVSLEMSYEEETMRLVSNLAQVPLEKITNNKLSPQEQIKCYKAWEDFKKVGKEHNADYKLWVPGEDVTAAGIIQALKPLKLDVIVVDYIGLIQGRSKEQQWESLGNIAREFKTAAQSMDACIILLAQFDSDNLRIKYSRGIFEHANIVWGWHYGAEEEATGIVEIIQTAPIGKNRNCRPFNFKLFFKLDTMTICDYEGPDAITQEITSHPQNNQKNNYSGNISKDIKNNGKSVMYNPPKTMLDSSKRNLEDDL